MSVPTSRISLVCPVTQQRALVPFPGDVPGVPVILSSEDEANLSNHPMGWGALEIRYVTKNPMWASVLAQREETKATLLQQVQDALAGTQLTRPQRRQLEERMANGLATQEIEDGVEAQFPLPESEQVTVRVAFPVLGAEEIPRLLKLLKENGYNIREVE